MNSYEPELYSLEDEDGVVQDFELVDKMELGGELYYALVPFFDDPALDLEGDGELVVLKSEFDENDEECLVSIDDDDEYDRIGNIFIERLNKAFDDEEAE